VARCAKLREKRFQLESCGIVKESAEVHRLEKHCKELNAEFSAVAGAYESWQAGRSKFKSNEQLQSAKRRYETLTKQIASSTQDLETALCQRRKVNNVAEIVASPVADETAWTGVRSRQPKAKQSSRGKSDVDKPDVAKADRNKLEPSLNTDSAVSQEQTGDLKGTISTEQRGTGLSSRPAPWAGFAGSGDVGPDEANNHWPGLHQQPASDSQTAVTGRIQPDRPSQ